MSSIEKCEGTGCPVKKSCLRFTDTKREGDIIFYIVPYNFNKSMCEFQIETKSSLMVESVKAILNGNKKPV